MIVCVLAVLQLNPSFCRIDTWRKIFTEEVKLNNVIWVDSSPIWLRSLEDGIFGHRYEEGREEKELEDKA